MWCNVASVGHVINLHHNANDAFWICPRLERALLSC